MRRWMFVSLLAACGSPSPREPPAPITLAAAHGAAEHIDGELDDPAWREAEVSSRFVDARSGEAVTPYTEARALCDRDALTLSIYAADEDLVSSDRVGAILHVPGGGTFVLDVDSSATVRWHVPSASAGTVPDGVTVEVDADATLDVDDLEDEEWVTEMRIPWRALGVDGPVDVRANFFRRDQPRESLMRSLAWTPWRDQPTASLETLGVIHCAPRETT